MNIKKYPDRHWKNQENVKNFMLELQSKLGYTSNEDWYSLNIEVIQNNGGKSVLCSFKDSPQALLKYAFPDLELYPWRFKTKVPKNYWVSLDNQRQFIEIETGLLGYHTKEDYYKLTGDIINNLGGFGVIKRHKDSIYKMLVALYPDYKWLPWKFIQVSKTQFNWKNQKDAKDYCDWLYNELEYTSMDDWYNMTQDEMKNNCGAGLLWHFQGSPYNVLKFAYPEYEFDECKFHKYLKSESKLFKVFKSICDDAKLRFVIKDCKGKTNRDYPFDMGSITAKLVLECDGDQHFKKNRKFIDRTFEEIQERDIYKMIKAINDNFIIIRLYQVDILKFTESEIKSKILECLENKETKIHYISKKGSLYDNHKKLFETKKGDPVV